MNPENAIEIHGLAKAYHSRSGVRQALNGLDLQVAFGGVHALLGPNGSGKSTTLRILLGLARADAGEIQLLGQPVPHGLESVIDRVGAVVEEPKFFGGFTAKRTLRLLAQAAGAPASRVSEVLDEVGLLDRANDKIAGFSLGMKQRLAIASTLLKRPDLFILDEPTNGLDPAGIAEVRATIKNLAANGSTVLLSSHLLSEVAQLADEVTILDRGRRLTTRSARELMNHQAGYRVLVADPPLAMAVLSKAGYAVRPAPQGRLLLLGGGISGAQVTQLLAAHDLWVQEIAAVQPTLEDTYLELTGGPR